MVTTTAVGFAAIERRVDYRRYGRAVYPIVCFLSFLLFLSIHDAFLHTTLEILTDSKYEQFLMIARYVVELILVVLCGLGLHSTEVAQVGGTEIMIRFIEVSQPTILANCT
jgi:hypothetical protein